MVSAVASVSAPKAPTAARAPGAARDEAGGSDAFSRLIGGSAEAGATPAKAPRADADGEAADETGEAPRDQPADSAWAAIWFPTPASTAPAATLPQGSALPPQGEGSEAALAALAGSAAGARVTPPAAVPVTGQVLAAPGDGAALALGVAADATAAAAGSAEATLAQAAAPEVKAEGGSKIPSDFAALLNTQGTASLNRSQGGTPLGAPPPPVEVHHALAAQQLSEHVVWALGEGVQEVGIQLNPPDMGPLEVRLKLEGERVQVQFQVSDSQVRDVVQTSLPSLSSMLSARGLQLDQAQVFTASQWQQQAQPQARVPVAWSKEGSGEVAAEPATTVRSLSRRSLIDEIV